MSFFKNLFGIPDKPVGTTEVYQVAKDIIHRYASQIVPTPIYAQLRYEHPNIPEEHLLVLMYSAGDTARSMKDAGPNTAAELAKRSCVAYDQGVLMVTETSVSYHLLSRMVG